MMHNTYHMREIHVLSLEKKNGLGVSEMGCRRNCINYSSWMDLEPEALPPNDRLPVKGECYWKEKETHWKHLFQVNIC